jgi:hypothetical protein
VVWPQNHSDGFHRFGLKTGGDGLCQFCLKPVATVSSGLASNPVVTVSSNLASKPAVTIFSSLSSKLVATVSPGSASKSAVSFLVEPQTHGARGFLGLGLKTGSSGLMIWASKSLRRFLGLGLKIIAAVSSSLDLHAVILVFQPFVFSKSGSEPAIFVRIRRSFCASCRVSPNLSFFLCLGLPARSQSSLVCGQPLNTRSSTVLCSQVCSPREIRSVPS